MCSWHARSLPCTACLLTGYLLAHSTTLDIDSHTSFKTLVVATIVTAFLCMSQSADHDPFMPDSDREGLNTVRAQRADDLVEARSLTYGSCAAGCRLCRATLAKWHSNSTSADQMHGGEIHAASCVRALQDVIAEWL